MAIHTNYHFDLWAEYLAVTLANNLANCDLANNQLEKLRLYIDPQTQWPVRYKAVMHNHLIACNSQSNHQDGSTQIHYLYRNPCFIPSNANTKDSVTHQFLNTVSKWQPDFYENAWNLAEQASIPSIMRQLALRSFIKVLTAQLKYQGIQLQKNFDVQFFDGQNYKTFYYDSLVNELKDNCALYLTHNKSKQLAADVCFKHKQNKLWFLNL